MGGETIRPVPVIMGEDGVPVGCTMTSPTDNSVRAQCKAHPHTVVPIVFIPGIMGSNLRNKHDKKSVWNVNSKAALAMQWAFRWADTRQKKLQYADCELDENGDFPGSSATVPDAKTARKRGWGGPSRFSYGDFLRWLDDQLNADLCSSTVPGAEKSPWAGYEGKNGLGDAWNAEEPFQGMSTQESDNAWNHFFCPVHALGYNWLQSNGESGKELAQKVTDIIKDWNEFEVCGHKPYKCEKVILVSHSMGGLVARAAVHPKYGNAADKVLGIIHGELPANGAAAAYHHCRSGYSGWPSIVLGSNAAQVTAVFANSPGAMELLPNHQYPAGWLRARLVESVVFSLPGEGKNPYIYIYPERHRWWRLVDSSLIDPAGLYAQKKKDPWANGYIVNLTSVNQFHAALGTYYHPQTYIHYGADTDHHAAWNTLAWNSSAGVGDLKVPTNLRDYATYSGSNPVTLSNPPYGSVIFEIAGPGSQPGDGTVPTCSGEAPLVQGGGNVKQGFRLDGFDHQDAYHDSRVRQVTLYSIGKLLQQAKKL